LRKWICPFIPEELVPSPFRRARRQIGNPKPDRELQAGEFRKEIDMIEELLDAYKLENWKGYNTRFFMDFAQRIRETPFRQIGSSQGHNALLTKKRILRYNGKRDAWEMEARRS